MILAGETPQFQSWSPKEIQRIPSQVKNQETSLPVCIGCTPHTNIVKNACWQTACFCHVDSQEHQWCLLCIRSGRSGRCSCERLKEWGCYTPLTQTRAFSLQRQSIKPTMSSKTALEFRSRGIALIQHPDEARHPSRRIRVGTSNHTNPSNPCTSRVTTHLGREGQM